MTKELANVEIVGRLVRDAETRYTKSGKELTTTSVAINRPYKVGEKWEKSVTYINLVSWRPIPKEVKPFLIKGQKVEIKGILNQNSWIASDGTKRQTLEVLLESIIPIDIRPEHQEPVQQDLPEPVSF